MPAFHTRLRNTTLFIDKGVVLVQNFPIDSHPVLIAAVLLGISSTREPLSFTIGPRYRAALVSLPGISRSLLL